MSVNLISLKTFDLKKKQIFQQKYLKKPKPMGEQ